MPLLDDTFRVCQKKARADAEVNRVLTAYLLSLDVSEFGDAIGVPPG